jgi:hypothetical protein
VRGERGDGVEGEGGCEGEKGSDEGGEGGWVNEEVKEQVTQEVK